jgi:hypothetical protein
MGQSIGLRSSVGGVAVGSFFAAGLWWAPGILDDSIVLIAAVGIVWAAATASMLYLGVSHPAPFRDAGPWGTVIGGSLLFGVVLNLSDISISNGAWAALTVLAIGFTVLGYAAGVATVYRQERDSRTRDETPADD